MLSTRNIAKLMPPGRLHPLCRAVAMLDAILFPDDWESRYHSYDPKWARGEQLFSMRNGQGDFYFVWFPFQGAVIRGFDHESSMSPWSAERAKTADAGKLWPGLFSGLPKKFDRARTEVAFVSDEVTFVAWWSADHEMKWRIGDLQMPAAKAPDGSQHLLFILDGKPATYAKWATWYAGHPVSLAAVKKVYAFSPLTESLVRAINPEANLARVLEEAKAIRYPIAAAKPAPRKQPAEFTVSTDGKRTRITARGRVVAEGKGDLCAELLAVAKRRVQERSTR